MIEKREKSFTLAEILLDYLKSSDVPDLANLPDFDADIINLENALRQQIEAEQTARENDISDLQEQINDEIIARQKKDCHTKLKFCSQ